MKLEVGMYVRTKTGFISKILEKRCEPISCNTVVIVYGDYKGPYDEKYGYVRNYYKDGTSFLYPGEILKVSHNIMDLIKEGDYVNGSPVCLIKEDEHNRKWIYPDSNYKVGILENEIKSIVTKEQFERIKYEVGD